MKFVVAKSDLKAALSYISIALSGNAKDPATSHALITVDKDGKDNCTAKIAATDRYVFCEATLDIRSGDAGQMLIPGQALTAISTEVEDGDIEFTATKDSIEVKAGRAEISLPTISVELFPYPTDGSGVTYAKYNTSALQEALKFIKVFVGTDKGKPSLMITELRNKNLMASDEIRVGSYKVESFPEEGFVLQTRGIPGALDFLKMEASPEVLIGRTSNFTWWKGLRATVAFRGDERTFPEDIEKTMGKVQGEDHFKIQQECLEHVIRRLRIPLDDTSSKMTLSLSGDEEGTLKVQTVNARGKASEESIPVVRTGGTDDISFSMGWKDLLGVIQANVFEGSEITMTYSKEDGVLKVSKDCEEAEVFGLVSLRD